MPLDGARQQKIAALEAELVGKEASIGDHEVEFGEPEWDGDEVTNVGGSVSFIAGQFFCPICRLRLDSPAELAEAKVSSRWEIEGADYREFLPPSDYDEDAAYDTWREERADRERWR